MGLAEFLKVGIVADDKTGKGIKSAKKNISSLEKSVQNLGKTFASVFAAQKLINYTKLSAKAAAADQASAAKLANAVKNLGLQYSNPYITDYIASMEKQAQIADDELRPAFQTLITQTGSLAKSQELLATAINVSRGSGESLATVSNDLAQAYVGNTKGLKKYYLGLTNAQLAATNFVDIQKLLNDQFAGASKQYLNTYQGQIDTLTVAFGNLQESAGRAFFTLLGGTGGSGGGASVFARLIDNFGAGLEIAAQKISDFFIRQTMSQNAFDAYIAKRNAAPSPVPGHELALQSSSNNSVQLKLEKERQALIKKQLASQKALTDQQKQQALLKKQGSIFDLQQIELIAALKGKLSDEDRKRAELQLALLQEDESTAKLLTSQIADAIDKTGNLKAYLNSVTANNDPFKNWMDSLERIAAKAATIGTGGNTQLLPNAPISVPTTNAGAITDASGFAGIGTGGGGRNDSAASVTINVAGSVVTEQKLIDQVIAGTQTASLSGVPANVSRIAGMFGP